MPSITKDRYVVKVSGVLSGCMLLNKNSVGFIRDTNEWKINQLPPKAF